MTEKQRDQGDRRGMHKELFVEGPLEQERAAPGKFGAEGVPPGEAGQEAPQTVAELPEDENEVEVGDLLDGADDEKAGEPELSKEEEDLAKLQEQIEVQREDVGALRTKLTVTVPREVINEKMEEQYTELRRDALIPGFRKGHAPVRLVEKRFAEDVGEQLTGLLVGRGFLAAAKKVDIDPLGDPLVWVNIEEDRTGEDGVTKKVTVDRLVRLDRAMNYIKLPKEGPLSFSCEVELRPKFELPTLEGIPVKRPNVSVTDNDVDIEVKRLRTSRGTLRPVESGPVEKEDVLYVDLKMTVDDQVLMTEQNIEIAARDLRIRGVPLIGLADALAGQDRGANVTFEATVPDDHENVELRGKRARFEFVIQEIKRLDLPPVDDAFLLSVGHTSEEELRGDIRRNLESRLDEIIRDKMRAQVADYLISHSSFDVPEGLSQRQAERAVARRMVDMLRAGVPEAEISKAVDEMRAKAHDQVLRDLKVFFVLEKIAQELDIEVNEDELNGAIAMIARRSGKRFDRVRDDLSKGEGLHTLYLQLRDLKVLDKLLAEAEVTEDAGPEIPALSST